ncbi:MAG: transglycosylase SLT domain-containing protein [Candidatus Dormibacteria bacterium]
MLLVTACSTAPGQGGTSTTPTTATPTHTTTPSPALTSIEQAIADRRRLEAPDPDALATRIESVEHALRSAATPAADIARLGELESASYIQLVERPSWRASVLAELSAAARDIAQANLSAAIDIDMLNKPVDTLPHWRVDEPLAATQLLSYYRLAQQTYGVPWQYLAAINLVETNMGRIHGLSSAGAQGPMQFLPATWSEYGEGGDIDNPADAIPAAARYLKAHGAPGDMQRAVYAYNPTDLYVRAVTAYATQMQQSVNAFYGYDAWPVYVSTTKGYALLPVGFSN